MRDGDLFDSFVSKANIASAKNLGAADGRGLQNGIIIRIAHDGWRNVRRLRQNARSLQKSKVVFYGFSRQGPSGLKREGRSARAEPLLR